MNIFKSLRISLVVAFIFLTGCATQTKLDPKYWKGTPRTVAIVVESQKPTPITAKAGAQGLLDIAINNSMSSDLDAYFSKMDVGTDYEPTQDIENKIQALGHKPIVVKSTASFKDLPDFQAPNSQSNVTYATKDIKGLLGTTKADAILYVYRPQMGTIRNYYGFIPLGAPKAFSYYNAALVSSTDNSIIANIASPQTTLEVSGDWDQPPNYPNITTAVLAAIKQAKAGFINALDPDAAPAAK